MAGFIKGDVVIIPFPFSNLSASKRRPALVLADLPGDDIILCQITSQQTKDIFAVPLLTTDLISGYLPIDSYIRPTCIFTADKSIIIRQAGKVNNNIIYKVVTQIISLIR